MTTRLNKQAIFKYVARQRPLLAILLLCGCCLLLVSYLAGVPIRASAHTASPTHKTAATEVPPTMTVVMGFDSAYRVGYWIPLHVRLHTGNSAFQGKISASLLEEPPRSGTNFTAPWSFEQPVSMGKNTDKQLTVPMPFYSGNNMLIGVIVKLRNAQGKVVSEQSVTSGNEVLSGSLFIGTIADSNSDFDPLSQVYLPSLARPIILASLSSATFPSTEAMLENFDILILDNFNTHTLHPDQLLALQSWVNRGGILIEVGGLQWQRTLGALPDELVPVSIHGIRTLPAGTRLVSLNDPLMEDYEQQPVADALPQDVPASVATIRPESAFSTSETIMSADFIPLAVRANQGEGSVYYLAIDPTDSSMVNWDGDNALWRLLLTHALGDNFLIFSPQQSYNTGPGQLLTRAGILKMLEPEQLPGPMIILVFLLGYVLILGPLRLFIVKRKNLKRWNWPIFVCIIGLFTLLSYELTFYQRSASIVDTSISLVQVNQGGTSAHVTTYSGIYVPNSGDFTLHIPGEALAQPIGNQYMSNRRASQTAKDIRASAVEGTNATNLTLQGLGTWTLHQTITEQDTRLPGGITSHLFLHKNRLEGSIKNTLNRALKDVYVLFPHNFVAIGSIGAGEEQQINLPISKTPPQPWGSISDQIAESVGLPSSYFPYLQNQQPQTDTQRHQALLSALNSVGSTFYPCHGACKNNAVTTRSTIYVTGGRVPNPNMNNYDPILEQGSQATLIGWTDGSLGSNVTINGWQPIGHQESFVQMPLNIDISSPLNMPPDFISGHVVGIQSSDAELRLSGIYVLTDGSLTFEMNLPDTTYAHYKSLTVTAPDLWAHPYGSGSEVLVSHLQALLYNWQTQAWDPVDLQQDRFTTFNPAAYVGPSRRVLVQITNKDATLGNLYFGTPSVSLQ